MSEDVYSHPPPGQTAPPSSAGGQPWVLLTGASQGTADHVRLLADLARIELYQGEARVASDLAACAGQPAREPALTLNAHESDSGQILSVSASPSAIAGLGEITIPAAIDPFTQGELLLEVLVWVAFTPRAQLIPVVGAHGGAGATTVAVALAQAASAGRKTCLVNCDFLSGGDLGGIHLDPQALCWSEILAESGVLLADRVKDLLGRWGDMCVLPATEPVEAVLSDPGVITERIGRAIRAVSATHEVVIIDLPRYYLSTEWAQAICRHAHAIAWVARADAPSLKALAAARTFLDPLEEGTTANARQTAPPPVPRVFALARNRWGRADLAQALKAHRTFVIPHDKRLGGAKNHGWASGELARSPITTFARRLWREIDQESRP